MEMHSRILAATLCLWIGVGVAIPQSSAQEIDRRVQPNIPKGELRKGVFESDDVYPQTRRDYAVYVPAQYKPSKPANLMVFMDGMNYAKPQGAFRTPIVFDNLIHQGDMPVTVAVFVNPGTIAETLDGAKGRSNRSFEYDSLGDRYTRFLLDEFLPVALEGINISSAPEDRAVCGISSGGISAFTVAWQRPDQFGKVLSHIGSYTNIRGGWAYPGLIRKTQGSPKPLKVYLQEGKDDLDNLHGSWPLANRDMAAALQFAGYHYKFEMTNGGHGGKWAGEVFPNALRWLWNDSSESSKMPTTETKPAWTPHPDAVQDTSVPQGQVIKQTPFESEVFENTIRDWSIYIPAQYDAETPAALMVFQDGERMGDVKGRWRIPIVFDNLIARGEMPPTVAVFINPGHHKDRPRKRNKSSNRGFEYDSLGDRYSQFLLDEILPVVEGQYNISQDPKQRAIGGSSSGAICAFTVAWERNDRFQKVFSSVGSFTNLRGGDVYPALIRKTEPKSIRMFMADTSGDLDNAFGNWPLANQRMAAALKYMGYELRFDWAEGFAHNADFGGRRFPDAMKWLWRSEVSKPEIDTTDDLRGDLTLLNLLVPGESWEVVSEGLGFSDAPCSDAEGNFFFSDMRAPAIYRVGAAGGDPQVIAREAVSGLMFSSEGVLYGCQGKLNRIVSIDVQSGDVKTIAEGVKPNDLAVSDVGIFITETQKGIVTHINPSTGQTSVAAEGINRPNGIVLSPDGGTLAVSEHGGDHVWMFRVNEGGRLDAAMPNMSLRAPIDPKGDFQFNQPPPYQKAARGDGSAVDRAGRYYVTSALGVQIFDPTGRPCGVLPKPDPAQPLTSCVIAGSGHDYLYVTNGSTVYRRKLTIK